MSYKQFLKDAYYNSPEESYQILIKNEHDLKSKLKLFKFTPELVEEIFTSFLIYVYTNEFTVSNTILQTNSTTTLQSDNILHMLKLFLEFYRHNDVYKLLEAIDYGKNNY